MEGRFGAAAAAGKGARVVEKEAGKDGVCGRCKRWLNRDVRQRQPPKSKLRSR